MTAEALCVGDTVCLFSEETFGYVYCMQTSSTRSELALYKNQKRDRPQVPDPQVISFQICIANRYKLNKKHRALKAKSVLDPDDQTLRNKVAQAVVAADAENEDNVAEQHRQQGKKLLYGQIIQVVGSIPAHTCFCCMRFYRESPLSKGTGCRVIHSGQILKQFEVKTGVRQGCLLSPFLFLLAIDGITKIYTKQRRNGIQLTLSTQL
ncbi:hypothetical protein LSH36_861g02002 [Paralvinella palmiformis]|uniref:Uncharacterized protein n=1 Tax=Paralvinella palmiformis TaxID=53620 RepID=A0AAD9IYJ1_9ANNE|nr:hypothetical protein LSH36_861g02002 [Paralvinella palmiformis]